jgi:hypothetical protein
MAFTNKPTYIPEWASTDVYNAETETYNVVAPDDAKKELGWDSYEKPPRNYMNWLQRGNYQWIEYFEQFYEDDHTFVINEIVAEGASGVNIEGITFLDSDILFTSSSITISNQANFENAIERVSANTYKFSDNYRTILVRYGEYDFTACLSGGDTWGQLQTNNVTHLEFERYATITFGNTPGYLNVNTTHCYLKNVIVKGLGTVASAVQYSFLSSAAAVTFDNCVVTTRLSNTNMTGFQGSATASHNLSTRYINCRVTALTSSGNISGFYLCQNMVGCTVNNCACTGTGVLYGFSTCDNISSSQVYTLDSVNGNCAGFYTCNQVSACNVSDIDTSGTGVAYGYHTCSQVSANRASALDSTYQAYGFNVCNQVSGCYAYDIQSTNATANGYVYGFYDCDQISACYAYKLDTNAGACRGFYLCNQISSCKAEDIDSAAANSEGFGYCTQMSSCYATAITGATTAEGFNHCTYGAALNTDEAANAGNDYMDTTDTNITHKFSTMATSWT